jgi:simple sugar transport system ATP-binding protein
MIYPLDLEIRPGEILGLAGLLGSGRTETAQLLFGVERADSGSMGMVGQAARFGSPREAIRAGLACCPEDRKREGILADLSIRENIVLALQAKRGWWRKIGRRQQLQLAKSYVTRLGIKAPDLEQPIGLLSGGNQQKALLARWLATDPKLLILDEPTRGIDVGAKFEIMQEIVTLCAKGLGLLFISSEISEVTRVSHRVAVLKDRRKIAELGSGQVNEDAIYKLIAGTES